MTWGGLLSFRELAYGFMYNFYREILIGEFEKMNECLKKLKGKMKIENWYNGMLLVNNENK